MVEEGGVEPPYIPATSKLPGNVARLVVNPDSFYLIKLNLWQTLSLFRSKCLSLHQNSCFTKNIYSL